MNEPPLRLSPDLEHLADADLSTAVPLGDRIWWVGHYIEDDPFQCHVYLIENGDQSVLIDAGSLITWEATREKIEQVVDIGQIRYFVTHHQDPDVAGALLPLDELVTRSDARIVTHWRAATLLKHLDVDIPFWLVDEHDWRLDLGDRALRFIFTPYMHFPGAFCTFDEMTGVLSSSDIFGGFTDDWSLVAQGESYFESLRPFHEHYMPSHQILVHGLREIERHPVKVVAPQHGSLIPQRLVGFMFDKLKSLECGLYLMTRGEQDIRRLMQLNDAMREMLETLVMYRDFDDIAASVLASARRILPATAVDFYVDGPDATALCICEEAQYRGVEIPRPAWLSAEYLRECTTMGGAEGQFIHAEDVSLRIPGVIEARFPAAILPLQRPGSVPHVAGEENAAAFVVFRLAEEVEMTDELDDALRSLIQPLHTALERELIMRQIDQEREAAFERAARDPLTGLYNRGHMTTNVPRLFALQERDPTIRVAALMMDIDHFKSINDEFGHAAGDEVLRRVAGSLQAQARDNDVPVRIGGEEFAFFLVGDESLDAAAAAERLRRTVAAIDFSELLGDRSVTVSVGVASRTDEGLDALIARADSALYRAKRAGRNRVVVAGSVGDDVSEADA